MNNYPCTNGEYVSKAYIDRKVRESKQKLIDNHLEEYGYIFCVDCLKNELNTYIDCSHIISVDECQKTGRSELAWDIDNMKLLCRECHQKYDGLNLQFNANKSQD